jgi:hypothetical protein
MHRRALSLAPFLFVAACSSSPSPGFSQGGTDGGADAPVPDTGATESGPAEGGDAQMDVAQDTGGGVFDSGSTPDSSSDSPADGRSGAGWDDDAGLCTVATDAGANLMIHQPDPSTGANTAMDWDDSWGTATDPAPMHMTATTTCGEPSTHWTQTAVQSGQWIKIYPNNGGGALYYLATPLAVGASYIASIAMAGAGTYHLDIWDGAADNAGTPATLSASVATTLTQPFTVKTGSQPEFQVRIDDAGAVSVDVTMWNLSIVER